MILSSNVTRETQSRRWLVCGCLLAAISVGCGAIGAHLLKDWLGTNFPDDYARRQELWETASRYLMYHAIGLIFIGIAPSLSPVRRNLVGCVMLFGVLLFSGCLYAYTLTNIKPLVHIVPLGGFSMIIGWLMFAWFSYAQNSTEKSK